MVPSRVFSSLLAVAVLCSLANEAAGHGTYHEQLKSLDEEIAARPADAALYSRRAFIHLEHEDWQACLLDVERARRCDAAAPALDLLRARALAAGGKHPEALAVLDAHLKSQPRDAAALVLRARALSALRRDAEAAEVFSLAMREVERPEPDAVYEHVALLGAAGRKAEALAVLDAALERTPSIISLVNRAVALEVELGRADAAAARVAALIPQAAIKEPLMARHAALLAQAGETDKSLAAWRALQARLAALPPPQRGSHAMSKLAEQAAHAIAALTGSTRQTVLTP